MTRQYFTDQKNLHSHTDELNIVDHPSVGENRSSLSEDYQEKVLEKANNILSNHKQLLTYVGSFLALGLIIGTASVVTYRLRKKKSAIELLNKWFSRRF